MNKYKLLIVFVLGFVATNLVAQDKYEKESRIKTEEVPINAKAFIDSLRLDTRIKWYKEEGIETKSIEAKFRLKKVQYSIEFDTHGIIEDVEIEVKYGDLQTNLKDKIVSQLNQDCSKHKITKVQMQFTGSKNDLFLQLQSGNNRDKLTTLYELIIQCNQKNAVDLFEYLFDQQGNLISKSKIIFKNSSHLEY